MRTKPQNIPGLIAVVVLAVALTWALSGQATARGTFQSPLEPGGAETGTPTPDPANAGIETPFAPPEGFDATPTPTETVGEPIMAAPIVTETLPISATATVDVPGFLPAPTLVNPSDLVQGRPALAEPGSAPLVGPAQPPEATPAPAAQQPPDAAQLIDNAIVALGYLWLCCGVILVAVLALVVAWLARRSRRR